MGERKERRSVFFKDPPILRVKWSIFETESQEHSMGTAEAAGTN